MKLRSLAKTALVLKLMAVMRHEPGRSILAILVDDIRLRTYVEPEGLMMRLLGSWNSSSGRLIVVTLVPIRVYSPARERVVPSGTPLQVFLLILGPPTLPETFGNVLTMRRRMGRRKWLGCLERIVGPMTIRLVRSELRILVK